MPDPDPVIPATLDSRYTSPRTDPKTWARKLAAGFFLRRATPKGNWSWLLIQSTKNQEWGFPKGHLDPAESFWHAAVRETYEETGITDIELAGDPLEITYELQSGMLKQVVYFPGITRAKRAKLSDEHLAARWVKATKVRSLVLHASLVDLFETHCRAAGLPC